MFIVLAIVSLESSAAVNWLIQVGGMYMKQYGAEGTFYDENGPAKGSSFEAMGGIFLQIPLTSKLPIFLETGLDYRNKLLLSQAEGCKFRAEEFYDTRWTDAPEQNIYHGRDHIIELPVKAGYNLKLNEKNSFVFGFGPYAALYTERGLGDPLSIGLTVSAAFRHRCMSFGLSYSNPVFLNGPRDYYKNSITFNIGINLQGRTPNWDNILMGLEIAEGVLGGVNSAMQSAGYGTSDESNYYSSGNESSRSSGSGSSRSSDNVSSGSAGASASEMTSRNTDKNTYFKYETTVIKIISGDDTVNKKSDIQKKMKKLREKWSKRNLGWDASPYETK